MFNIFKRGKKLENKNIVSMETLDENKVFSIQVDRNLEGKELEKKGDLEAAIKLYEENLNENFEGSHPYNRLAIIYRTKKLYEEEKRVLNKAIKVFEDKVPKERADREVKLNKFRERLYKLNIIIQKKAEL